MNKKEQKEYAKNVKAKLQQKGVKIGFLLTQIGISRTHWQFIKNGDRPLTEDNKSKIEAFLK